MDGFDPGFSLAAAALAPPDPTVEAAWGFVRSILADLSKAKPSKARQSLEDPLNLPLFHLELLNEFRENCKDLSVVVACCRCLACFDLLV